MTDEKLPMLKWLEEDAADALKILLKNHVTRLTHNYTNAKLIAGK